ncbi:phage tail sheath subtilisin-like domain-containing protein [Actinophytocola sp.]|uniref:phage tail sheath subtilisin-like domain-containing protein n=1 Tax=Actinophytocola sp. TaxID=1872138 RepID=UPI002D2FFD72|nr:phage tail sheath subtilisin-like domain-containing protein [Actinophytocola sp.]HYQ66525.1 phage tail sheath subtilisin-like domain-containing protein [Actinophytocola sp.]
MTGAALPGVSLTFERAGSDSEPLRTDVAVFIGRTRRGPVGVPVRVGSWNDVVDTYGPPDGRSATPYALRGFFENEGRAAWVLRLSGPATASASAPWTGGYVFVARSPGAWANGGRITVRYRGSSVAGPPSLTVRVQVPGEPVEILAGVAPDEVVDRLATSRLISLVENDSGGPIPVDAPISMSWDLTLTGGADVPPGRDEYAAAVTAQAELPEPALVASPDLGTDLAGGDHSDLVLSLLATCAPLLDRLVLLDVPPELSTVDEVGAWVGALTDLGDEALLAAAAVYHPPLRVPSLVGTGLRTVPAAGHVAGLVARLDDERGAASTPANATLLDAVDLAVEYPEAQQVRLFEANVDLVRCVRGRGLVVWGGRTLSGDPRRRFVAHRRLLHVLVRAIRRVAAPLVFDVNSPELRLTLVRAITSVLLENFRTGALAGTRPEQAFRVVCDDTNNPSTQDPGTVVCDVEVAPAVPMEFVRLRLVLGQDRGLEVIES